MLGLLLTLLLLGIVAGFLARLLVPGKDSMGFFATVLLGIVGSFIGGFLSALIFDGDLEFGPAGILGSIVGAVIALVLYNAITGRKRVAA